MAERFGVQKGGFLPSAFENKKLERKSTQMLAFLESWGSTSNFTEKGKNISIFRSQNIAESQICTLIE